MSIFIDSPETIFRMINWMALLIHENNDIIFTIPYKTYNIKFTNVDGMEMHSKKYYIRFDRELTVYIDYGDLRLTIDSGENTRYYHGKTFTSMKNISQDKFLAMVPQELNDICEYVMGCQILKAIHAN